MKKRLWRVIIGAALIAMSISSAVFAAEDSSAKPAAVEETVADDDDSLYANGGDSYATATEIALGETISGSEIGEYFKVTVNSSGILKLNATTDDSGLVIRVVDRDGTYVGVVGWGEKDIVTGLRYCSAEWYVTAGTYYISTDKVIHSKYYSNYYDYTLTPTFESFDESFPESYGNMNNSWDTASSIVTGETYKGLLANNDGYDYYKVTLNESGKLSLSLTAYHQYAYCYLYNDDMNKVGGWEAKTTTTESQCTANGSLELVGGTYYFLVSKGNGDSGTYDFSLSFSGSGESFTETQENTANDALKTTGNEISLDQEYCGQFAVNDANDYYKLVVDTACTVTLTSKFYLSGISYTWYDSNYDSLGSSVSGKWNETDGYGDVEGSWTLPAGTNYLQVSRSSSATGNYTFTIHNDDFFVIDEDNNSFSHSSSSFFANGETANYWNDYDYLLLEQAETEQGKFGSNGEFAWHRMVKKLSDDWGGSCLGMVISMAFKDQGLLTDKLGTGNYYDLGKPVDNHVLRNVINYFQMTQDLSSFKVDNEVINDLDINDLVVNKKGVTLKEFLTNLATEAKQSFEEKVPFVFEYWHNKSYRQYDDNGVSRLVTRASGHAVLICGYKYGDVDKDGEKEHRLTIYDVNHRSSYLYMDIADDYSSFEFEDGNGVELEETWKRMQYVSYDTMKNASWFTALESAGAVSANGNSPASETDSGESSSSQVSISISAYQDFTLTNAAGKTLSYKNDEYSGDMTVYSAKTVGESNVEMILTVDASDSFTLTDISDDFELSTEIAGGYYTATTTGASQVVLSKDSGIAITGDSYTFSAGMSTSLQSCDLVIFSGKTSGTYTVQNTQSGVTGQGTSDCTEFQTEMYQGTEYESKTQDGTVGTVTIADGIDGKAAVFVNAADTPVISSVKNGKKGVTVKWNAVSGAKKYRVYYKGGSVKSWTKAGDTASASYTVKGLTSGKTYFFTVQCISPDESSYDMTGTSIKYLTAGKIKSLTNTAKGVKLTWKKVAGAKGYYICRKAKGGSWKKIKTIKKNSTTSYTDKGVKKKNGKTYTYAVKPYSGKTVAAYVSAKTVRLTGVTLSSVKNAGGKKAKVKWKKNAKATGYQIQYSLKSNFSSAKTKTVKKKSTVSAALAKLKKGKKYYVRVRAYKKVSGKKYYSAWSKRKSVKISK